MDKLIIVGVVVIVILLVLYNLDEVISNIYNFFLERRANKKNIDYVLYIGNDIKESLLDKIIDLDKTFFRKKYLWSSEYQKQIFNRNKDSFVALAYNDELIGYINYLVISKDKFENTKNEESIVDDYELEDILCFRKNEDNYITINSIVIDKKYHDGFVIKKITNAFIKHLRTLNRKGYKIKGINSTAVSNDGRKFLTNLGFTKYKTLADKTDLFLLEDKDLNNFLNN